MLSTNPFTSDAFGLVSLSAAINYLPNRYGRLEEMGLFPDNGVSTRQIAVEEKNGVLNLLPTATLGSPGTVGSRGKRKMRSFIIPHIPHEDLIKPEEIQGVREFGTESTAASLTSIMADHLQSMKDKHSITLEHLRMGAMKGIILDADGSTLYNLYTEFGIVQKTIDFALDNAATDVKAKCVELNRHLEDNLMGEFTTGTHCLVSEEFFDALTSHAKVIDAWDRWQDGEFFRSDNRKGFKFCGITFEEYRGKATDPDGNVRRFIAANEGHAFPLGTANTFKGFFAPADFNETANTLGQRIYAKQELAKYGRGIDLHTQSNPLPICLRPGVLVKVTI